MLIWAGLVGGVAAGLWPLVWAVQAAAVAMYGVAALMLLAARLASGVGRVTIATGTALFSPPAMRRAVRRQFARGWAAGRSAPLIRLA